MAIPPSDEPQAAQNSVSCTSPDAGQRIAAIRDRKLAPIKFRRQPLSKRKPGEALNFLSRAQSEEFQIPEVVPISAHPYGAPIRALIDGNPDKLFLDVGAGLRPDYHANVVNLDIFAPISTDVVSIAEDMPFAAEQFDFVLCFSVLEHVRRPWDVASEIARILKPGGQVIADYPFMSPIHGYPNHYFNATPEGNRALFEGAFDITSVEIAWHHHPAVALQWMLTVWRDGLPEPLAREFCDMTVRDFIVSDLGALLSRPIATELHESMKRVIAAGSTVYAVKRPR